MVPVARHESSDKSWENGDSSLRGTTDSYEQVEKKMR